MPIIYHADCAYQLPIVQLVCNRNKSWLMGVGSSDVGLSSKLNEASMAPRERATSVLQACYGRNIHLEPILYTRSKKCFIQHWNFASPISS